MYRLIKTDGTELGITDSINYIKISDNGCFVEAKENDAIGVAYKSTPYNLIGHEEIEGADTVIVSRIDSGDEITQQKKLFNVLLGVE